MIPIQLTIEGLYSYQTKQTIDFSNLIEAGLFGIFGTVGSGKSSILEAISFALYGETERMNSREKRAYNMMNLRSNQSFIEFDFYNYNNDKYRVERRFKRNSKKFDDVKPTETAVHKWVDGIFQPVENFKIEEIIGLSYENFKRTIIIPQGQFKEFLELGATERTNMMKDIFNLQKYDLQHKTADLVRDNNSKIDHLEGQLSGFESVSENHIKELEQNLKIQIEQESEIKIEFDSVNGIFQQLKVLKTDFELLKQKKETFENLKLQKKEKDAQEKQLNDYEQLHTIFQPILLEKNRTESEIQSKKNSVTIQQENFNKTQIEVSALAEKIERLKPEFDNLPQQHKIENELDLVSGILTFQHEIEQLKNNTQKGLDYVQETSKKEQESVAKITNLENEIKEISKNKLDASLLMAIDQWFNIQENLQNLILQNNHKLEQIKGYSTEIEKKFKEENLNISDFDEIFHSKNEKLGTRKKELEKQKNDLVVQQKLSEYTHNLHDGEPCPLCGATEHPNIAETNDVSLKIKEVDQHLNNLEREQKESQNLQQKFKSLKDQKEIFDQQFAAENENLKELNKKIEAHQSAFVWKEFNSNEKAKFELKKQESLELEQAIVAKNTALESLRQQLENERNLLNRAKEKLEKYKIEETQKETQILQNQSQLKSLVLADYVGKAAAEVQLQAQNLKEKNDLLEQDFKKTQIQYNELTPKLASEKSSIELLNAQIQEAERILTTLSEKINSNLEALNIDNLDVVLAVLDLNLNVPQTRESLNNFKIEYETLKRFINELEKKLAEVSYDESAYILQEEKLEEITEKHKEATENVTKTTTEIERLTKAFNEKKDLLKKKDELAKRAENLKTLANLFKGAGFVQYVSSIYLRQLCDHANVRFHRMTRNQLSLQLNDNNDFEIIDYLNEGRTRSVKTLSGGQAFQVSLSLALALAESVQTNAKSDKNFFFIDEGFGTQDAESINIVFETLQSLQKENRIVGIISHVEELKERIPISLNVYKDEESGSTIETL